jgi:hypothetical protein
MTYEQLPLNSVMHPHAFITAMNLALESCVGYQVGMSVQSDGNGYWLELNGIRLSSLEAAALLTQARMAVLLVEE